MNEEFINKFGCSLVFTEDAFKLKKGDYEEIYPYIELKDIRLSFPNFLIITEYKLFGYTNKSTLIKYNWVDKTNLKKAVEYAKNRIAECAKEISHTYECDSMKFNYNEKAREIKVYGNSISVEKLTFNDGMSYWEDVAFHQVKIIFYVGNDKYIIQGRTYGADGKILPFKEYYKKMIRDSEMQTFEKDIVRRNVTIENVDLLATTVANQSKEQTTNTPKEASVVGRAIAGAAIAGTTGAIVGALSAVDKNNRNNKSKK